MIYMISINSNIYKKWKKEKVKLWNMNKKEISLSNLRKHFLTITKDKNDLLNEEVIKDIFKYYKGKNFFYNDLYVFMEKDKLGNTIYRGLQLKNFNY